MHTIIHTRTSAVEAAAWLGAARQAGMTLSAWLRWAANQAAGVDHGAEERKREAMRRRRG